MTTKELKALQEEFDDECFVIDMAIEYGRNYVGEEKNVIITELSCEELYEKYSIIVAELEPFDVASPAITPTLEEFKRNEHKFDYRMKNCNDCFCFDDEIMAFFHPELQCCDEHLYEKMERIRLVQIREKQKETITEGLSTLSEIQRKRVIEHFYNNKSSRVIAKEEGVNYNAVDKSLKLAIKKLKKFIQKRVCISTSHCK